MVNKKYDKPSEKNEYFKKSLVPNMNKNKEQFVRLFVNNEYDPRMLAEDNDEHADKNPTGVGIDVNQLTLQRLN